MNKGWLRDLSLKTRSNSVKTFKSYVDFEAKDSNENQTVLPRTDHEKTSAEAATRYPQPTILPGELLIAEAENVLKFNTLSELNKGISGLLTCTNFKLSFTTSESFSTNLHQRNLLLGENDICLINIDALYQVIGGKRKKICNKNISDSIEIFEVHCKDFRIYTFSFKFSPANAKTVIRAIYHHAFASEVHLLYAFYFTEPPFMEKNSSHSLYLTRPNDWEVELERCGSPGWRLTLANEKFQVCDSLPECFIIPAILLDMNLIKSAPSLSGHRVPTWSWGLPSGASIVRMGAADPGILDNKQIDLIIDVISRTTPELKAKAKIFNADELCPSIKDIESSFGKLKELCMPTTAEEYWEADNMYLTRLESTKWLHNVSSCLSVALQAASILQENVTVILMENEGKDVNCILSSLVQIFVDPMYRTQSGFQDLIQKEWVALGHPFTERLHHINRPGGEESPVFLLFLDCVWQLLQQCPTMFEFSETYLTTIWDSCHISLFDTFLFNNHKSRLDAFKEKSAFCLRSVWNWTRQFTRNDIRLFNNPFYILNKYRNAIPDKPRPQSFSSAVESRQLQNRAIREKISSVICRNDEENLMKIDPNIKSLKLWHQCYFRWIPLSHILGGGSVVLYLNSLKVADEISAFEELSLKKSKQARPPSLHRRVASEDFTISSDLIDNCHKPDGSRIITSVFPFSPVAPWDWHAFQSLPPTSCLQINYCSDDDLDD